MSTKAVPFQFDVAGISGVTAVKLAGEFNSWTGDAMTAPTSPATVWTLSKNLARGSSYAYKFIVTTASGDTWYYDQNGFKGKSISAIDNSYVAVPSPGYAEVFFLATGSGISADVVGNNSAAEKSFIKSALGSNLMTVPGGTFVNENVMRIKIFGVYETKATPSGLLTIRLKVGGQTICTFQFQLPDGVASVLQFGIEGTLAVVDVTQSRFAGILQLQAQDATSGSANGHALLAFAEVGNVVAPGVDLTQDQVVDVTGQWATADSSNFAYAQFVSAELLTPPTS